MRLPYDVLHTRTTPCADISTLTRGQGLPAHLRPSSHQASVIVIAPAATVIVSPDATVLDAVTAV